jgi:hypothetical protein
VAEVARQLKQAGGEPNDRSAVSRFFYGSYHACSRWLQTLPGMASAGGTDGGTHQVLLNQLRQVDRNCSDEQKRRGRRLAALVGGMKERRVIADYMLHESLLSGEVQAQEAATDTVFSECDKV